MNKNLMRGVLEKAMSKPCRLRRTPSMMVNLPNSSKGRKGGRLIRINGRKIKRKMALIRSFISKKIRVWLRGKVKEGSLTREKSSVTIVRSTDTLVMSATLIMTEKTQGVMKPRWPEMMMKLLIFGTLIQDAPLILLARRNGL